MTITLTSYEYWAIIALCIAFGVVIGVAVCACKGWKI